MIDYRPRWFQLRLKSLFLLILLVAVFLGGYMAATRSLEERMDAEREARRQAEEARTSIQEELDRLEKLRIVVFRHHPGLIDKRDEASDPQKNSLARNRDAAAILRAAPLGTYWGGLGSGYQLEIQVSDLAQFKSAMDRLLAAGSLTYYDRWGLNRQGYGLVPIH